jgi:hypothetical protein
MKFKQFVAASIGKKQAIYVTLLGLGFSGCATTLPIQTMRIETILTRRVPDVSN